MSNPEKTVLNSLLPRVRANLIKLGGEAAAVQVTHALLAQNKWISEPLKEMADDAFHFAVMEAFVNWRKTAGQDFR